MNDLGGSAQFGRVGEDGTVYVRTPTGERVVGQWPGGDPAAALAFYCNRFAGLAAQVDLVEKRVASGALSPSDASAAVQRLHTTVSDAQVVGDLDSLLQRLSALEPVIQGLRDARRADRAAKVEEARRSKARLVEEAERLATSNEWRIGVQRLSEMVERWKSMSRIDKAGDEALWKRFSAARTTYTRRRKQHYAELDELRSAASAAKQKLVAEAEAMSSSTEWGATARAYRDLMTRWKAAGVARKQEDEALWRQFRAAQDIFFTARDAENAKVDAAFSANAQVKRAILADAEKLLPVKSSKAARDAFRVLAQRWDEAGKVPRGDMKDLESRFSSIEQTIRGAEDDKWRSSNPEASARAAATVAQLEASISAARKRLAAAEESGNQREAEQARSDIEAKESWLEQASKAVEEFGG